MNDNDGNTSNVATVTIEYTLLPPVANDNSSTGNDTGTPVRLAVLANDTLADGSTPDPDDVIFDMVVPIGATNPIVGSNGNTIGFTVPGEGVWSYDETTGEVTFTPEVGFTNDPTPIDYNLTDVDTGITTVSPATITIDYAIEFPIAEDDQSLNNPTGTTASVDLLNNDSDPDGNLDPDSVNLITPTGATNVVTDADVIGFDVPGEGTWGYDPVTGALALTPEAGFVEDPTPITYTVDDNDGNTSNVAEVVIDYIDVADLSLTKIVVDNDTTPLIGSEITFQLTITNDGPQHATGVVVTDLLPSGYDFVLFSSKTGAYNETTGIWTVGNIATGTSETLLIDVLINATGDYLNVAEVTSSDVFDIDSAPNNDDGDQSEDDEDNALVTPVASIADLSLTKNVVDGDTTPLIGTEITFQLTVTNDGPENATGVEVADLLPSGYDFVLFSSTTGSYDQTTGVWTVGNIASGTSETLLIDVLVNATGDYLNVAEVTSSDVTDIDSGPNNDDGDQSEDDEDNALVTPVASIADLSLTKNVVDGDTTPLVGSEITFRVTVRNDGPEMATGVEVTDVLPSGYDFLTFSSSTGTYDEVSGIWEVGNLENGAVETLLIDVQLRPNGDYLNTTEVTASAIMDMDSTPGNGIITEDDYAEVVTVPIQSIADLSISKTTVSGRTIALPGDELRFQITISNAGPELATNVEALDLLPIGFEYIQHSATSGTYDPLTGLWDAEDVPADGSQTIFIDVLVKDPTDTPGEFVNSAEIIASDQLDPDTNGNGIGFPVKVPIADISLVKSVSNDMPNVGDTITFTLRVNNEGPDLATGVDLVDVLPIGYSQPSNLTSPAGQSLGSVNGNDIAWTNLQIPIGGIALTYDVVVNMPTLTADEYKNVVQVTGSTIFDPDATPNNDDGDQSEDDEDSLTIITPGTDVAITKTVDNNNPAIGDEIIFTITASNLGSLDATTVEIRDELPTGYEFVSATATHGSYAETDGFWRIPTVAGNASESLDITVVVLDIEDYLNTAVMTS